MNKSKNTGPKRHCNMVVKKPLPALVANNPLILSGPGRIIRWLKDPDWIKEKLTGDK